MIKILIMCENPDILPRLLNHLEEDKTQISLISTTNNNVDYSSCETLELYITNILHKLGISPKYKGYLYLKDAINMYYKTPIQMHEIYTNLSIKYSVCPQCIERGICRAIEIGFVRNDIEEVNKIFGNCLCCDRGCPTNLEFIATVVERLKNML